MNINKEIKDWLDAGGKDFDSGFALLKGISRNPFFMNNILRLGESVDFLHKY
jgi:hypothetical protein